MRVLRALTVHGPLNCQGVANETKWFIGGDRQVAGVKREDRVCKECSSGEVEDVTQCLCCTVLHWTTLSPSANVWHGAL